MIPAFAQEILGKGVAVKPSEENSGTGFPVRSQ